MENCTSLPYTVSMSFIEAPIFSKLVYDYLSEDEYAALQLTLAARPETGKVIPETGGLRKVRWSAKGKGKRGGTRIIYFYQKENQIWLITIYTKNEVESIPVKTLNAIKEALGK